MKSVYIRELRRYTKLELSNLFPKINSNQLTVFIRKLRAYGILKSVKRDSGTLDLIIRSLMVLMIVIPRIIYLIM